ncbi:MAG TPA: VOC family protein [Streptosporangiaceae bacterium]|nr:VOC family protein [Streptosporangiaceae bacterium]
MLSNLEFHTTIPVKDLERAKVFYREKLGLSPSQETPGGLVYESVRGSWFFLFPSQSAGTAQNTVMAWVADDIAAEVAELKSRGVVFEEYDSPGFKSADSIVTMPSSRNAWFKDSEGNTLGIAQLNG